MSFPMVIQESIQTHYCSNGASWTIKKQPINETHRGEPVHTALGGQKIDLLIIFFLLGEPVHTCASIISHKYVCT